jgi:hypothetical protein
MLKKLPILSFRLFSLLLLGLVSFVTAHQVQAQTNQGLAELRLSLSPPVTYLSIKPGETKPYELTLTNNGQRDLSVQLQLADFTSDGKTGTPVLKFNSQFTYLKPSNPAWNWNQAVVVKKNETVKVPFVLAVPTGAKETEAHLTILAKGSQIGLGTTGSTAVAGTVGSNLIIAIAQSEMNFSQVEFGDWKIPKTLDSLKGLDVTGLVKNTGQQSGPILGKATLTGPDGQMKKTWLFYPDVVLPGATRAVRVVDTTTNPSLPPASWFGQPNVKLEPNLSYKPSWMFGAYTLKLELYHEDYAENQPRWQRQSQIFALPFTIVAVFLAIPISVGIFLLIRRYFPRQFSRLKTSTTNLND